MNATQTAKDTMALAVCCSVIGAAFLGGCWFGAERVDITKDNVAEYNRGWKEAVLLCERGGILKGPITFHDKADLRGYEFTIVNFSPDVNALVVEAGTNTPVSIVGGSFRFGETLSGNQFGITTR